jgi:tRNA pseudouridine38-40 synthase
MSYRLKCTVSYDGTHFLGYQRQKVGRTIQGEIEKALFKIHTTFVEIQASGRTDRGVHALNQVFHFDTTVVMETEQWKRALNSILPKDIHIKSIERVDPQFHARYHVVDKEYRYYLSLDEYNPLKVNYTYFYNKTIKLDVELMKRAIKHLEGTHDYKLFTSRNERHYTVRTIYEAEIKQDGQIIEFIFRGNGFLRYQVRVMVGTLIEIGVGKRDIHSINELLSLKEGIHPGKTAEPQALYLSHVSYKSNENVDD